jgi:hypothetical protein
VTNRPDGRAALERAFTDELLKKIAEAAPVCRQERLRADVEKYGGPACARELLRRDRRSEGFGALADAGKLALSLEALAAEGKYGELFADEEVNRCFAALCAEGYYRFTD